MIPVPKDPQALGLLRLLLAEGALWAYIWPKCGCLKMHEKSVCWKTG